MKLVVLNVKYYLEPKNKVEKKFIQRLYIKYDTVTKFTTAPLAQ